jgi:hypothetical protein
MKLLAWVLMCSSLVLTAWAHLGRRLPSGARRRLISAGIVVLAVGLALGALSGDW